MPDVLSTTLSVLALSVSSVTAWLTLFRRGTVKMTQPTTIFFGPDGVPAREGASAKIYLRSLLFSTSKRGRIVENMYVSVKRNETAQNFNIWVYGESKELVRGSGLFVGETGVEANHHFLTPKDNNSFNFTAGNYFIEVYAHLLGDKKKILLFSQALEITKDVAQQLSQSGTGVFFFDWGPDSLKYLAHVDKRTLR